MTTQLEAAKSMFPNMPDEVFDLWLAPLIESDGWPFNSLSSPTRGTIWYRYFEGHSLYVINNLFWEYKLIPCLLNRFHPNSVNVLALLAYDYTHNLSALTAELKDGKGRESFTRSQKFIKRTGRIHTPVVFIVDSGLYQIMDGNHRIAALFSIGLNGLTIEAWIGDTQQIA